MAVTYKWEANGLYRTFTDTVLGNEILEYNLNLHGDVRFDTIRYVINDFTGIEAFEFCQQDLQKVCITDKVASKSNPHIKIALISTHKPLVEWFRLYIDCMQNSIYQCDIFGNTDAAYEWVLN